MADTTRLPELLQPVPALVEWCHENPWEARSEIERLRKFVQWVGDHSNDPAVVREAKRHGAE